MTWPSLSDYQEAIQNPSICFCDLELKQGTPTITKLGLPKPITGAFASVYEINCGNSKFAVRCFLRQIHDQEDRYRSISNYLHKVNLKYFVKFHFIPQGIFIRGEWFPILKMEWIKGLSLIQYIEKNLHNPSVLKKLSDDFYDMACSLNNNNISHGDFQHGNIIIANSDIKLVDYDGMYVPGLEGLKSNEIGHPNYQHPIRTSNDYGKYMDNFSTWIIYSSLVTVCIDPSIWTRLQGGEEHLLFRKSDFLNPINSSIFRELESSNNPNLFELSKNLKNILKQNPLQIQLPLKINVQQSSFSSFTNSQTIGTSWMKDHITEQILPPDNSLNWIFPNKIVEFKTSHIHGQTILIAGTGILFLSIISIFFIGITNIPLILSIISLEWICIGGCFYFHYIKLPEVNKKKDLQNRGYLFRKELLNKQNSLKSEQNNLKKLEQKEKNKIDQLNKRKLDLPSKENQEIQSLNNTFHGIISRINSKRSKVDTREKTEISDEISRQQTHYLNLELRRNMLTHNSVPGIGPVLAQTLHSFGYRSAADINNGVINVPGIGESRAFALLSWKRSVEMSVRAKIQYPAINVDFIKQKYKSERDTLENEEITARNSYIQSVEQIRTKYRQETQIIENQIIDIKKKFDQNIIPINQSILQTEKSIKDLKKKISYSQDYLKAYSNINMLNYLKYLISQW